MKQINSSDPEHSPTNAPFFITKKTRKGRGVSGAAQITNFYIRGKYSIFARRT